MNESLKQILLDQISGAVRDKIADQVGTNSAQTDSVVDDALTAILGGLKKNTRTDNGAESLDTALNKHDGSIFDDLIDAVGNRETKTDGGKILEHIFGSKTDQVAESVAKKSGVDASTAADMLSVLAPIVLGQLGKSKAAEGLDAGGIADKLLREQLPKNQLMDVLAGVLDRDKDGQILDDLLDMGQGILGKKKQ